MQLRHAPAEDLPRLAEWNHQLIQDEQSPNRMSVAELESRMRGWLASEYRAAIFEVASEPVAYALYRMENDGLHVRQFFVARGHRRKGLGRRALTLFCGKLVPDGATLSLDVLAHNHNGLAFWRALGFREYKVSFRLAPSQP